VIIIFDGPVISRLNNNNNGNYQNKQQLITDDFFSSIISKIIITKLLKSIFFALNVLLIMRLYKENIMVEAQQNK
jgi:hypothetical protein